MNPSAKPIAFGRDKSQIVRGLAIIFMITLHNDTTGLFKICVPIFTFLVGYGYAFARQKNVKHGLKRIWHLLSHFWLILLGLFLPVAIWKGGYEPTMGNVLLNMFGLESNLNWYSWYIYFYIFAMFVMIPASAVIRRFGLYGTLALAALSFIACFGIHSIGNLSENVWLQAAFDCFICAPVMFASFYLAVGGGITTIKVKQNFKYAGLAILIATGLFFLRGIPFMGFLDFVTVPVFVASVVALLNIVHLPILDKALTALGKESMNMWFFHAVFATAVTAAVFAPLINWVEPKAILIVAMIVISYFSSKAITAIYNKLSAWRLIS